MRSSHPEPVSMEDRYVEEGLTANVTPSGPATAVPSSVPSSPTTAISMASNDDCVRALHSPAEASPAKPTVASPTASSSTGSHIASASDSAAYGVRVADFIRPNPGEELPGKLRSKGVTVILENDRVWKQFYQYGTEMILSKPGRRMFPYCRYRVFGLAPDRYYAICLSIVLSDRCKYRWNAHKWEAAGPADPQLTVPAQAFLHHSGRGSDLMTTLLSSYRLKITNNSPSTQEGHIILNSMHRYIPQLHIIPLAENTLSQVMGPDTMTFTFPQTEFIAVTTYQNFLITQLKIKHNPFAKGFREDRIKSRLSDASVEMLPLNTVPSEKQPESKPVDQSPQSADSASPASEQESNLVLEPISNTPTSNQEAVTQRVRGGQALKVVVVTQKRPRISDDANDNDSESPSKRLQIESPEESSVDSMVPVENNLHTPNEGKGYWAQFEGGWKSASPACDESQVSTEPELDEVEGLTFVSFDTKEAMESHIQSSPDYMTSLVSPDSCLTTSEPHVEPEEATEETPEAVVQETDEEKIARLEALLLEDLKLFKHRQVIHPVLQEVGLKLNSLDSSQPIDLQYLGVRLPLPPLNLPGRDHEGEGLAFISRTGKTSDMTKIKGWKNKFVQSQQASDASQKNLSAFCSNMLDEYLENEAQHISERADNFSTSPESAVAYELPAKSASYVKTLDSALQQRKISSANNRSPHQLPFKPLLYAALTSPAPQLPSDAAVAISSSARNHRFKTAAQLKVQHQLLEMEEDVVSHGYTRTQLSPYRVLTSLTAMRTREVPYPESPSITIRRVEGPECGQEFCRLGCICLSLYYPNIGTDHCRRPECMFDCSCSNLTTQDGGQKETNQQPKPHSSLQVSKLWHRNIFDMDPEPLFLPENPKVVPATSRKPYSIREEEKDPVYRYLESFMTCARVRAFNSKPPPQPTLDPDFLHMMEANSKIRSRPHRRSKNPCSSAEEPVTVSKQMPPVPIKKQIEIQSVCHWKEDRAVVLEKLCMRLNQDNLSEPFNIGPYYIHPVTKIFIQKPSGSNLIYRVRISRVENPSDLAVEQSTIKERQDVAEPVRLTQVKPFLGGVLPAGLMIARTKPVNSETSDLIQVNGKTYGNVNLLLGSMGSLHPANRLAAYATGRLIPRPDLTRRLSRTSPSTSAAAHPTTAVTSTTAAPTATSTAAASTATSTVTTPATTPHSEPSKPVSQNLKVTSKLLPLMMSAKNTSDIKSHPLFQLLKQPREKNEPEIPTLRQPPPLAAINLFQRPAQPSVKTEPENPTLKQPPPLAAISRFQRPAQPSVKKEPENPTSKQPPPLAAINLFQRVDRPPVSLTVSSSMKTPSFLSQSGTYSFRICPPSNSGVKDQNQPGVTLPGGFKLLRIPKPEELKEPKIEVAQEFESNGNVPVNKTQAVKEERLSSAEDSDDSSLDYSAEHDSDVDSSVDVETYEESNHEMTIERLKQESETLPVSHKMEANDHKTRQRKDHSEIEKQRRIEQRALFDKLQKMLGRPAGSRLSLLSLALKEIHLLRSISGALQEKKERLMQNQAFYLKRLSSLSGRPEEVIKRNLNILYSCLKDNKGEPFLLRLCQSKSSPNTKLPPPPTSAPPKPSHQFTLSPTLPPPIEPNHQLETLFSSPQNHVQQNTSPSCPENPSAVLSPPTNEMSPQFTVPLVRSKTGRLILPSSLKPGKGIYALMLMNSNKDANITTQPSNGDTRDKESPPDAVKPVDEDKQKGNSRIGSTMVSWKQVSPSSDSSPSVTPRPRGRPPKRQNVPKEKAKPDKDKTFFLRGVTTSIKRGRGRPRKDEIPSQDNSSVVRPRTRGSLGKDFPSAKRQSWLDIEMALDPDLDSE
ncbi:uncharacterized protein magl isoform X3 [Corythoichthys intestinalis]|uniref:uncharacterized protein magl isoform X3 n=1 Tax=Corythoichthys intestinalis TaxID=161448 RepID=UPI0025A57CD6|nr:uncharacterized protein magl isoform X3 [Corythoichthys intestinalis]